MRAAWSGTPTTTAARAASWRTSPTRRCSSTGSSSSAWCASKAGSRRYRHRSPTPTTRRVHSTHASGPGPRRRASRSRRAQCWWPTPPRPPPGMACIRRGRRIGAAIASCRTAGSSGRAGAAACTTACATSWKQAAGYVSGWRPDGPTPSGFAQPRRERLAELRHLGADHERAVALVRVALEVVLVVVLGAPVVVHRLQFGDDTTFEFGVDLVDHRLRDRTLRVVVVVDAGAVLRSNVVALSVQRGRIVDREEDFQH